ncbi:hypothetical protein [Streptomyces decoyicus]
MCDTPGLLTRDLDGHRGTERMPNDHDGPARHDFTRSAYETVLHDVLIGTWQKWLTDLGERVDKRYDGTAPDAGNWTPEHSAFLGRLGSRLAALTGSLRPDGFSLRQAAAELDGIVQDVVRFTTAERLVEDTDDWHDESRTAVALELAAARLLASGAAPVMPRFAGRLSAAPDLPEPTAWPRTVELLTPGSKVRLSSTVFFRPTTSTDDSRLPRT